MEKERSLKERCALDYIPQVQTPHCHRFDVARLPDWGQSEAKPPADVEIGTSLGRYLDFPLLLSHSYHVPLPIPSFLLYATNTGLRRLISDYTGFDR